MTVYAWPTLTVSPTTSSWTLVNNASAFVSPLTGYTQTMARTGNRWRAQWVFQNVITADRAELQAFLAKLNGLEHRFYIHDHAYTRRGSGSGGLVNGASQTGNTLVTDGWPTSQTIFKAGDQFSYDRGTNNHELKIVTQDATSDGSGNLTINIWPEIHVSPANNASIRVTTPFQTFMLESPDVAWSNAPGSNILSGITFTGIEDLN